MSEARIEITGAGAEDTRAELEAWWKAEMGEELRRVTSAPIALEEPTRSADPVAVAALILGIPSAIVATMDIAKRIELTKKVGQLIEWAREKRRKHPKLRIALVDEAGQSVDVAAAEPPDVLEALALRKPARAAEVDPVRGG